jgi:hypothetical protein
MLSREPETVSLSDHSIARNTPTKLLRNHASRLSGQPKARQHLFALLVPEHRHAAS